MPVIGITPCGQLADYVESIRRAGGDPVVLSLDAEPSLNDLTGLLLTGGGDIDPAYYDAPRHPEAKAPDARRDAFETALAKLALSRDLPMLGICRGLQVINVVAGGTLLQDIPSDVAAAVGHQIDHPLSAIAHEVWLARDSRLQLVMTPMAQELIEGEVLQVNSRHHQAVARIAAGFDVSATAPDGIIEAIERRESRFCLAVQWHPENFWRTGEFRSLFETFVAACQGG